MLPLVSVLLPFQRPLDLLPVCHKSSRGVYRHEALALSCRITSSECSSCHRPHRCASIADLCQQVNVEFSGEKQGFGRQQSFDNRAHAGEFGAPLRVVVTRHIPRPLNVQCAQVAVAGGAQLPPHLRLFGYGYLKYRFPRHTQFTSEVRLVSTYPCIRKNLSVPIS